MPTVVATVGGSTSNSYVTVATATTYFDERLNASAWDSAVTAADDDEKRALIMATRLIDREEFKGEPVKPLTDTEVSAGTATQALKWPRYSTHDDAGWSFDEDEIPLIVQHATMEWALYLLNQGTTDPTQPSGLEGFKNVAVGPLNVTPRIAFRPDAMPSHVRELLRPVLRSGSFSFRVGRS